MKVKVKKLHPNAVIPSYSTDGAACFDLYAATVVEGSLLHLEKQIIVGTGLSFEIPSGCLMRIIPRSNLNLKYRVAAFPIVIDSSYRGEVKVTLNFGPTVGGYRPLLIRPGDRIAQAYICEVPKVEFVDADNLTETRLGTDASWFSSGFGSTGK
jgi:dUTP pyrophosphatase